MDVGKERYEKYMQYLAKPREENVNPDFVYKSRPGDVIIFGPPKTGTNWLQNVLHEIRMKGEGDNFEKHNDVTWYIEDSKSTLRNFNAEQVCNPRIYKCHLEYGQLELVKDVKCIFIVRDPYDTAYSSSKFVFRLYGGNEDVDDGTCATLLQEKYDLHKLCYFRMLNSWWPHRNDADVHWLFYEEMKKDLTSTVGQLAEFINIQLTHHEIEKICKLCSFEYMSENDHKFHHLAIKRYNKAMGTDETWTPFSVVRKDGGQVGQGRQVGPETRKVIERLWSKTMKENFDIDNYTELYSSFVN